jgi:filamentous hemagglutinin family protein
MQGRAGRIAGWCAAGALAFGGGASAAVIVDHTLGPGGALAGPDYAIGAALGRQVGANLFFSFERFGIARGESATFSGPATTARILSRVTGGEGSSIDGLLRSTIAGADFYFINPAGVVFGPNASIDIPGAFYVSSAHYLALADGGSFDAANPGTSTLTAAAPEAFGFLGGQGELRFSGSQLSHAAAFAAVGGEIDFDGARLTQFAGRLDLVSTNAGGEVRLGAAGTPLDGSIALRDGATIAANSTDVAPPAPIAIRTGRLGVTGAALVSNNGGDLAAGDIDIDASVAATLDAALPHDGSTLIEVISSDSSGAGTSAPIHLSTPRLTLDNFALLGTEVFGAGDSGDVIIDADDVTLQRGGAILTRSNAGGDGGDVTLHVAHALTIDGGNENVSSGVTVEAYGDGASGTLLLEAGEVSVTNGGAILSDNYGSGVGGDAQLNVGTLSVHSLGTVGTRTFGEGAGGALSIAATQSIEVAGAAFDEGAAGGGSGYGNPQSQIITALNGAGAGGALTLAAPVLTVVDIGSVTTENRGAAPGGSVTIDAAEIHVDHQAAIGSFVGSSGNGGDVDIHASTSLTAVGVDPEDPDYNFYFGNSQVFSFNSANYDDAGTLIPSTGNAGAIRIDTPQLTLTDYAEVSTAVSGNALGQGGSVDIAAARVRLERGGGISSTTFNDDPTLGGAAGSLTLVATESLDVIGDLDREIGFTSGIFGSSFNGGASSVIRITTPRLAIDAHGLISTSTFGDGDAGPLFIEADEIVLTRSSGIFTAVYKPEVTGDAGTLDIVAHRSITLSGISFDDESQLTITNQGQGAAGTLHLTTPLLTLQPFSLVQALNAGLNPVGGTVLLEVGDLEVQDSAAVVGAVGDAVTPTGDQALGGNPNITIMATRGVHFAAGSYAFSTAVSQVEGAPNGGSLTISAASVRLDAGATFDASTLGPGRGGSVRIEADTVDIGGTITTASQGSGSAGSISFVVGDAMRLLPGASIETQTVQSAGGDVELDVGRMLSLDHAQITTSAAGGNGNGGNISIDPRYVVLRNSAISANAFDGDGGNISIVAGSFLSSADSTLTASSALGINGSIDISAPDIDVGSGLGLPPAGFLDATKLLHPACASVAGERNNSLVVSGRGGFAQTASSPMYSRSEPGNRSMPALAAVGSCSRAAAHW